MDNPALKAIRSAVLNTADYKAAEQPQEAGYIKLNSNENQYPMPEKILSRISEATQKGHNFYPPETALPLRAVAAHVYGVTADNILVGNGSSELLSVLFRAMLNPGETAAMPSPGFTLNRKLAALQGGSLTEVPWEKDYNLPVEALLNSNAKFIIVANPNNPTGTACRMQDIETLAHRFQGPVVVDEAYVDFAKENALALLSDHQNIIVLRTFSKSYSAAGVRVGFAIAHEDIITQLRKIQNLYCMDSITQKTAIAILDNLNEFIEPIEKVKKQRERSREELTVRGFTVLPSQTNFVLAFAPENTDGRMWEEELRKRKILVRHFNEAGLTNALRIGMGTESQMDTVFRTIDQIRQSKGFVSKP